MKTRKLNSTNVLKLIDTSKEPLNFKAIFSAFGSKRNLRTALKNILNDLKNEGKLIRLRNRRYTNPASSSLEETTGIIESSKLGFGFLLPDDPLKEDIYIHEKNLNGAFHRDRVTVKIIPASGRFKSSEGIVSKILERGLKTVIGRFFLQGKEGYVNPVDEKLNLRIRVLQTEKKLKNGDICAVSPDWSTYRGDKIAGKIVRNFRNLENPDDDVEFVIYKSDLRTEFSPSAEKELLNFKMSEKSANRQDLKHLPFITIDPEDAKDFDDAVYAQEKADKSWDLWVAIADVSEFVREGSAIDREAYERATSFYFPGKVVPMLPEDLSNGSCSLSPGEDKFTVTVKITLSPSLEIKSTKIMNAIIKNHQRANYDEAQKIIESKTPGKIFSQDKDKLILSLHKLSQMLFKKRMAKGGIDFDLAEPRYIYDKDGTITDIKRSFRVASNQLIEEFMLLANRVVSKYIDRKRINQIFRIHEEPDPDRLKDFYEKARTFGYQRVTRNIKSSHDLNDFLNSIKDKSRSRTLRYLLLRSMKQAKYSTSNLGHYGLGFEHYAHFTSPIRRYPDLVIHRIVKNLIACESAKTYKKEKLEKISQHSSKLERKAGECERDILKIKCVRFMQNKTGKIFQGYISGKVKSGFFIELKDHMVEGFCPSENIRSSKMPKKRSRTSKRETFKYSVGDQVKVKLVKAVLENLQVEFEIIN